MSPTLKSGDILFFSSIKTITDKSIVLFKHGGNEYVKRASFPNGRLNLSGDNVTDSRDFMDVDAGHVIGVLIGNKQ